LHLTVLRAQASICFVGLVDLVLCQAEVLDASVIDDTNLLLFLDQEQSDTLGIRASGFQAEVTGVLWCSLANACA
jgi:hypothetical protein